MIIRFDSATGTVESGVRDLLNLGFLPPPGRPRELSDGGPAGSAAHRILQEKGRRSSGARKEVTLRLEQRTSSGILAVGGRADLIVESEGRTLLVEIKTLASDPGEEFDPMLLFPDYMLQAFIYCRALEAAGREGVEGELHLFVPSGRTWRRITVPLAPNTDILERIWLRLAEEVTLFAVSETSRMQSCAKDVESLGLPFPEPREGQMEMVGMAGRAVEEGEIILIEAPPGAGKTSAILAGALPAALSRQLTTFFLTSRNTQRQPALKALSTVCGAAPDLRCIVLDAKERMCATEGGPRCTKCTRSGSGAWFSPLDPLPKGILGGNEIRGMADAGNWCPFELSLLLSVRCDIVVADCNYAFDPRVFLKRFFGEPWSSSRCMLLIDEAADLPDRARGYFSPVIRESWLKDLERLAGKVGAPARKVARPLRRAFRDIEAAAGASEETELPADLAPVPSSRDWMQLASSFDEMPDGFRDIYLAALDFERASRSPSPASSFLTGRAGGRWIEWFCADASPHTARRMRSVQSCVCFSATLSPPSHFLALLGLDMDTRVARMDYPFDPARLGVWLDPRVDTRLRARAGSLDRLCSRMERLYRAAPGTYLAFFPSFEYLSAAASVLAGRGLPVLRQSPSMRESDRAEFLRQVEAEDHLVMTVAGGIFAEGVDLDAPNRRGGIIAGPCLPGLDLETRLLERYYASSGRDGFLHAAVIPGVNRVIQAAGRLVRGPADRCVLVLFDHRFGTEQYLDLLPSHWKSGGRLPVLSESMREIDGFWESG